MRALIQTPIKDRDFISSNQLSKNRDLEAQSWFGLKQHNKSRQNEKLNSPSEEEIRSVDRKFHNKKKILQ